jgi:hypothetical protein
MLDKWRNMAEAWLGWRGRIITKAGALDRKVASTIKGMTVEEARKTVKDTYKKGTKKTLEVSAATTNWGTNLGTKTLNKIKEIPQALRTMSPNQKVTVGFVGVLLGSKAIRTMYQSYNTGSQSTPPPAFQGTYGRIEAMRHTNGRRPFNSDFGSGLILNRVARRKILPQRHRQW